MSPGHLINSPILDKSGTPYPLSLAMASGDYEAGSTSYRMGDWGLSSAGPNAALNGTLSALRARTRTLIRNSPYAGGATDSIVSNMVGTDISPLWEIDDADEKELLQELWADSQQELDFNEIYDFYGMTGQVVDAQCDAGEALGWFRPQPFDSGLLVPLQIQLLEADHLDASFNSQASNGNEIRMGIEWTKQGKRAAYWIFTEHPGELQLGYHYSGDRIRIPAADMLHPFRPKRIGQARGCPWLASSIPTLHELDQFEDATLLRKKIATFFAVFFEQENGQGGFQPTNSNIPGHPAAPHGVRQANTPDGRPVVKLQPGLSARLNPGEKVKVADPGDMGDGYMDFMRTGLRKIARGMGPITYEQLTGDLSDVNLSSIRYGVNETRRLIEMLRAHVLVYQWCNPIVRRWLDTAVLSGAWNKKVSEYRTTFRRYWRISWQPQAWKYMDPVKDRIAEQMDIRNGIDSRPAVVGRRGRDAAKVDQEAAQTNTRTDNLGLIYDTDPRRTAKSGAMQAAEEKTLKESLSDE